MIDPITGLPKTVLRYNETELSSSIIVIGGKIEFPTPFVNRAKNISYENDQQIEVSSWTLSGVFYISSGGVITPGNEALRTQMLAEGRASIIQFFRQNFKKLETDQGTSESVAVRSISFEPSNVSSMTRYSVVLEEVRDVGYENVRDIIDEWSWSESDNGFSTLVHNVSARGIEISNNGKSRALIDAKNWVKKRLTGTQSEGTAFRLGAAVTTSIPTPAFINVTDDTVLVKTSENESINRMAASYGCQETFQFLPLEKDLPGMDAVTASIPHANIGLSNIDELPALLKWTFEESEAPSAEKKEVSVTVEAFVGKDRADIVGDENGPEGHTSMMAAQEGIDAITMGGHFQSPSHAAWYWARQYAGGKMNHWPNASAASWGMRDLNLYWTNEVSRNWDESSGRLVIQFKFDNNELFRKVTWTNFVSQAAGGYDFNGTPVGREMDDEEAVVFDKKITVSIDKVSGKTSVKIGGELLTDPTMPVEDKVSLLSWWISGYRSENSENTNDSLTEYLYELCQGFYRLIHVEHLGTRGIQTGSGVGDSLGIHRATKPSVNGIPDLSSGLAWLNPLPDSLQISLNKTKGTVSISAAFSDEDYLPNVRLASYNIRVKPALTPYIPRQSVGKKGGVHIVFDPRGKRREVYSVSTSLEGTDRKPVTDASVTSLEDYINAEWQKNGGELTKDADSYSKTEDEDVNASSTFTFSLKKIHGFYDTPLTARNIDQKLWPIS